MNKKLVLGIIIGVVVSIGAVSVVLSGSVSSHDSKTKDETLNLNQSENITTPKHFSLDLNESVGIAAHP